MKTTTMTAIAAVLLVVGASAGWAQEADTSSSAGDISATPRADGREPSPETRQAKREQWMSLTPEDRARIREERQARWQAMSPEQRQRARERMETRRQHARERWQSLSADEQARVREERRARFESLSPEEQARIRERREQRRHDGAGHRQRADERQQRGGRSGTGG